MCIESHESGSFNNENIRETTTHMRLTAMSVTAGEASMDSNTSKTFCILSTRIVILSNGNFNND